MKWCLPGKNSTFFAKNKKSTPFERRNKILEQWSNLISESRKKNFRVETQSYPDFQGQC